MFELLIDKVIGEDWWGEYTGVSEEVSARYVRERLSAFPDGETEMRVVIDSPGGDVFEGITIFNIIRDFARNHADVRITTYIQGEAASMASGIALAANSVNPEQNKVIAEDNSVYMIHSAISLVFGNKNDMREAADFLEQVDGVLRLAYVRRTGKTDSEVSAMMDATTWLWGEEIKDAGFADAIIDLSKDEGTQADIAAGLVSPAAPADKNTSILSAKAAFANAKKTMQQVYAHAKDGEGRGFRAAAMALGFATHKSSSGGSPSNHAGAVAPGDNHKKGGCMTAEDLKRDNPDVYAQIVSDGEKAGAEKERARASRLLQLGEKSGAKDFALECIKDGSDPSDAAVIDAFMDKGAAARVLAAQKADGDVPELNLPKNDANADKDAMLAAFDRASKSGGYDDGDD